MYAEVSPTNDAGGGILNTFVGILLDEYQFTSNSGTQDLVFGDMVRVADDYDGPTATPIPTRTSPGKLFQWMGTRRSTRRPRRDRLLRLRALEGAHADEPDDRLDRLRGARRDRHAPRQGGHGRRRETLLRPRSTTTTSAASVDAPTSRDVSIARRRARSIGQPRRAARVSSRRPPATSASIVPWDGYGATVIVHERRPVVGGDRRRLRSAT